MSTFTIKFNKIPLCLYQGNLCDKTEISVIIYLDLSMYYNKYLIKKHLVHWNYLMDKYQKPALTCS